jgi:hypothetical protein
MDFRSSFQPVHQLGKGDLERARELQKVAEGEVALSDLDPADVGTLEAGRLGEIVLVPVASIMELADMPAEDFGFRLT